MLISSHIRAIKRQREREMICLAVVQCTRYRYEIQKYETLPLGARLSVQAGESQSAGKGVIFTVFFFCSVAEVLAVVVVAVLFGAFVDIVVRVCCWYCRVGI